MALSGIYAFSQPFSIEIIGLHALSGFVFIGVVAGHILNNIVPLKNILSIAQPSQSVLRLLYSRHSLLPTSSHQGYPWIMVILDLLLDMFDMDEKDSPISTLQTLVTNYFWMYEPGQATILKILHIWQYGWRTSPFIISKLSIHLIVMIVRLNSPIGLSRLRVGKKLKRMLKKTNDSRGVHRCNFEATANGSFDPSDYILPKDQNSSMPYGLC